MSKTRRQEQDTRPNRTLLAKQAKQGKLSRSDLIRMMAEEEKDLGSPWSRYLTRDQD